MVVKKTILFLLCSIAILTHAQNAPGFSFNIGDPVPPLRVGEWLKGKPIPQLEKDHIYVIEFWATWCRPCIAAMPEISSLQKKYKDEVTFIGVGIYELEHTTTEDVKTFVDSMGDKMNYHVATDDEEQMLDNWITASGEKNQGIPKTFVVNDEGKLAWIGHPLELAPVLAKILEKDWDIKKALEERNEEKRLKVLEDEIRVSLDQYSHDLNIARADSILSAIEEIVADEPKLKNSSVIVYRTFSALLEKSQRKAYDYGKSILEANSENNASSNIIFIIESYSGKRSFIPEIYQLGAEAYEKRISDIENLDNVDISKHYKNMAKMYWDGVKEPEAIEAQQKAIEVLKGKKDYSASDLEDYESQLRKYKEMMRNISDEV